MLFSEPSKLPISDVAMGGPAWGWSCPSTAENSWFVAYSLARHRISSGDYPSVLYLGVPWGIPLVPCPGVCHFFRSSHFGGAPASAGLPPPLSFFGGGFFTLQFNLHSLQSSQLKTVSTPDSAGHCSRYQERACSCWGRWDCFDRARAWRRIP